MIALEGEVKDNRIVLENDISAYNGNAVIVTILDHAVTKNRRNLNLDSYAHRTERGQHVDEYIREMRDHDRL